MLNNNNMNELYNACDGVHQTALHLAILSKFFQLHLTAKNLKKSHVVKKK